MKTIQLKTELHKLGIRTYKHKATGEVFVKKGDVKKVLAKVAKAGVARDIWNDSGSEHDKKYEKVWDKFVPSQGKSDTVAGELLRSMARIYNNYFRNGWGWNWREEIDYINQKKSMFKPEEKYWSIFYPIADHHADELTVGYQEDLPEEPEGFEYKSVEEWDDEDGAYDMQKEEVEHYQEYIRKGGGTLYSNTQNDDFEEAMEQVFNSIIDYAHDLIT